LLETTRHAGVLEERVAARTAQLETANQELEAFSYSVSHDLRAPLRGIDGWSLALLEDCGDQLDEKAHGYLDKVRFEAQRMGRLIDDLLQLSRVSRGEMQVREVDLSSLAGLIIGRLQETAPERVVTVAIQPGLSAIGDAALVSIMLTNLLENAWKFTGRTPDARIEFGREADADGKNRFFVRDNGAGFDMRYAGKIFGAFQRLHTTAEYPGTGIGLVIVHRIIRRHGGRIQAEAQPGRGAVFHFTLHEEKP
jgi:light-regulated signal transduction histidine kinase (bacteriophytochrome)